MRLLPRSLTGRLVVTALIATALALLLAALTIGHVLGRFVMHGLDDRLDAQVAIVARTVRPDGSLSAASAIDVPPFDRPGSGWSWEVIAPGGTLRSGSLGPADLPLPPDWRDGPPLPHRPHDGPAERLEMTSPLDGIDAEGRQMHGRWMRVPTAAGDAQVIAVGPREIVDRPLRAAATPLLLSLGALAAFLLGALIIQLRIGLRPLNRLHVMVGEVRLGRRQRLVVREPTELLPLVEELNALVDASVRAVVGARRHVANLAHGLKTPLATLRIELERDGKASDALLDQVDRMDRQIRHHLGRARAAESGDNRAPSVGIAEPIADLTQALARIHVDRGVRGDVEVDAGLRVRCDPQDLSELLGNILDNAWRHARSTVRVRASIVSHDVHIVIQDDGEGMSDSQIADVLLKGRRLDEGRPGHGFGLGISRELLELHQGSLTLRRAESGPGGLEAVLALPSG